VTPVTVLPRCRASKTAASIKEPIPDGTDDGIPGWEKTPEISRS
jgi:hypothetical protein